MRLVYAIRNPFDVIATMHRRSGLSIRDRIRWYFMHCEAAEALRERLAARFLDSHHASLLADPDAELSRVGDFLALPQDPAHVAAVRETLIERPRRTSDDLEWSPADMADIQSRMADFECLARYADERPTGRTAKEHS